VLDSKGQPVSSWWPVAFALQRVGDKRGADALTTLVNVDGVNTPSFAFRALGAFADRRAIPAARAAAQRRSADARLRVAAVRMLAQLKDVDAIPTLERVLDDATTPPNVSLEVVIALGAIGSPKAFDTLVDLFSHKWAPMRAAALASAAKVDPEAFLPVVSGLGPDKDWTVRAAMAGVFASLDAERVRGAVLELASEADPRVQGPALEALAKVGAPDLDARLAAALDAPDFNIRATAAGLVGARKLTDAAGRLVKAYERGQTDANASARGAALDALATLGKDAATPTLRAALNDKDWSIRLKAAALLRGLGDATAEPVRPAPLRFPLEYYESPALLRPAYSPHAFIETRYGTIEIELNVVEAPFATQSFVALARKGYFNGMRIHRVVPNFVVQVGDDRGDGAGGPGYTLRDELSAIPYRRATVGMALGGKDTGGSQFFITVSPQPHLDGKYAVFGDVVRGMEFVDQLTLWDVIERIRVWDGVSFQ
jgi:cyclophilin family peptidyl-prolyl cis-trans isomerase/HEAT repeat protein